MNVHRIEKPITITRSEFVALGAQVIKAICGNPGRDNATEAVLCSAALAMMEQKLFDSNSNTINKSAGGNNI